jgi:hypothetical protein
MNTKPEKKEYLKHRDEKTNKELVKLAVEKLSELLIMCLEFHKSKSKNKNYER